MMKNKKIAVLIPCYNESKTIAKVIADFKQNLPDAVIYVYDNNSTDSTSEIAKQAGAVVRYERRQGKGNVIRRMFREIDAHCYIMADGEGCALEFIGRALLHSLTGTSPLGTQQGVIEHSWAANVISASERDGLWRG